ncbi:MAG: DUF1684 domain-containing protein [Rudanella sp.]|nr:DUF1684 domain-containing protein [Rudanella sp.]
MKLTKLLWFSLLGILLLVFYFVLSPKSNSGDKGRVSSQASVDLFTKQLAEQREKKNTFFKTSPDSPIENKAAFTVLSYYPVSSPYLVTARFEPFADKTQKLVITLSDGSEETYEKYGHAVFKLQGEVCRLLILKHDNIYSILFKDKTSGKTTYAGGRYIDLKENTFNGNGVEIDFNTAYNPYCVYNHTYACPLPPAENTLPVAVGAGEKL